MIDSINVRTTQNVDINYNRASLGDRILAYLIDAFIIFAYVIVMIFVFTNTINQLEWISFIFFLPLFFYHLISEVFFNGQSIGKRQMGIKVIMLDGTPPTLGAFILRWILRVIDFGLFYGGFAVLTIILSKNSQRLGDLAAGTTVVKLSKTKSVSSHELIKDLEGKESYVVTFPEVSQLTSRQIELINQALEANKNEAIREPAHKLSEKIQEMLGINTDMPPIKFLYTVVKDYQHLNLRTN